jgi:hypothetical protein
MGIFSMPSLASMTPLSNNLTIVHPHLEMDQKEKKRKSLVWGILMLTHVEI